MKLLSKIAFTAGALGLSASPLLPAEQQSVQTGRPGPGDVRRTLIVQNFERSHLVHVPDSYDNGKAVPVVLVFHGGGSNARQWVTFCGLSETSDRDGFIAVYPNGTGKTFRAMRSSAGMAVPGNPAARSRKSPKWMTWDSPGRCWMIWRTWRTSIPSRCTRPACRWGGIMVYRLASELSDRMAAIAPVAASMGTGTCDPVRPVSVIHFHGTGDPAVGFEGVEGRIDSSGADFIPVDHFIRSWVKVDGCGEIPTIENLPDEVEDGTTVIRKTYGGDKDGAEVVLVMIKGGGHTWPGREFGPEMKILGLSTKDISANDMMWEFFKMRPMK